MAASADLRDIESRKQLLVLRCAAQRDAIGRAVADLHQPIGIVNKAMAGVRYLRSHPVLLGTIVAVLVAVRRRSPAALVLRAVGAWRTLRVAQGWLARAMGTAKFPAGPYRRV